MKVTDEPMFGYQQVAATLAGSSAILSVEGRITHRTLLCSELSLEAEFGQLAPRTLRF